MLISVWLCVLVLNKWLRVTCIHVCTYVCVNVLVMSSSTTRTCQPSITLNKCVCIYIHICECEPYYTKLPPNTRLYNFNNPFVRSFGHPLWGHTRTRPLVRSHFDVVVRCIYTTWKSDYLNSPFSFNLECFIVLVHSLAARSRWRPDSSHVRHLFSCIHTHTYIHIQWMVTQRGVCTRRTYG